MGNGQSQSQKFNSQYWRKTQSSLIGTEEYQNKNDNCMHISKHHIQTPNEQQFQTIKELSYLRKNNPRWVSALYFQYEQSFQSSFCNPKYVATLYLQKIPLRLSSCSIIPFPQVLHLYDQVLNGFWQLSQIIGCFKVEAQFIGLNQRGVVKVWAGSEWANISVVGGSVSQQDMIKSILTCLQKYIDYNSMPPQNFMYTFVSRNSVEQNEMSFDDAIKQLKNYVRRINLQKIPASIDFTLINRKDSSIVQKDKLRFNPHYVHNQSLPLYTQERPSLRKVNSMSNFQHIRMPANYQFLKHNQDKIINPVNIISYNPIQTKTINKSLSNPQLSNAWKPNYVVSNPPISFGNKPVYNHNKSVVSNQIDIKQPSFDTKINTPLQTALNNQVNNEQSKKFTIIKQSQLVIYPPSQSDISPSNKASIHHGNIRMQNSQKSSAAQTPFVSKGINSQGIKNTQQSQSIIIQLYKQREPFYNTSLRASDNQIFKYQSQQIPYKTYDASIIVGQKSSQLVEQKYLTPIGIIKKDISNLNSIEQVQTEHYWKQSSLEGSPAKKSNYQPYSLNNIKQNYTSKSPSKQLIFTNHYNLINQNDGKSSPQFLRQLKQGFNVPTKYTFQQNQSLSNAKIESSYNYDSNPLPKSNLFHYADYDSYGSIQPVNKQYDNSKYTTENGTYGQAIDPDIWADIQAKRY